MRQWLLVIVSQLTTSADKAMVLTEIILLCPYAWSNSAYNIWIERCNLFTFHSLTWNLFWFSSYAHSRLQLKVG